ncbi:hypothetical protein RIF29_14261 [Crotalaria pallida]|uniref:Protein FLX-like 2 n=1 Tax=Crotalaria pallida TaxID=3830 RepID=A0AAN9FB50_CROPI
MGSKGRMPPQQHMRYPLPQGPGALHPEPLSPGMRPPLGPFPPYEMLPPPPHVLEQRLTSQHAEMQQLARENQRLAATHVTLRQELAAAQQELQMLHTHVGGMKAEGEQRMRDALDNIAKMEAELQAAEHIKVELQKARGEAQSLVVAREELISKCQRLSQELQRVHSEVQHIPALMAELEHLRHEYQHCRATFEHEKKLYNDHLESLQVMEKNYVSMSREVEKLRAELTNIANVHQSSGPYGGTSGINENEASGLPVVQNAYDSGYGVVQGHSHLPVVSGGTTTANTAEAQPGRVASGTGYDPHRVPGYNASAGPAYDAQRGVTYDTQKLTGYNAFTGPSYEPKSGPNFDAQKTGYDPQRGPGYGVQIGPAYAAQSRGGAGPHGHAQPVSKSYGSTTPPAPSGGGYEAPPRGANPVRR